MKLSYQQIRDLINSALPSAYIADLYDDSVIYEEEGKYYQCPYAIMDGKLQMGQRTEVQKKVEYEAVKASVRILAAASGSDGNKWRVQIMEFGTDLNRTHWTREVVLANLDKFEGSKVFQLAEAQHQAEPHPFGKSTRERVGWFSNVAATATGVEADLNVLPSAKDVREDLVYLNSQGMLAADKPVILGLSVDIAGKSSIRNMGGVKVKYLESISNVTTDIVYNPAAGGKILRLAAATTAGHKEDHMLKQLLAALKTLRPGLKAAIEAIEAKGDKATDEEISTLMASVMATPDGLDAQIQAAVAAAVDGLKASLKPAEPKPAGDPAAEALKTMQLTACRMLLREELKASTLPDAVQVKVRKQFEGQVFEEAALMAAIKAEKEMVDSLTQSGIITGAGLNASVTQSDLESRAKMLDDFFKGANGQHSIRRVYVHITGDDRVTGMLKHAPRLKASIDTTTFDQIFADAIHKKMIAEYESLGLQDWRKIVKIVPLNDFKTVHRIRKGGYGNLPIVAEGADYQSLQTPTDEQQSYAPTKKGGTEDLTLEAIKGDETGSVRDIPMNLAQAAGQTLYEFVFNDLFASNPTMGYDTTALFHGDHNNLGAAALDATALTARRQAMAKQTRLTNGKRLAVMAKYLLVPTDLDKTGYDLIIPPNAGQFMPTAADYTKQLGMELIVVSCWTDATNWGLTADPRRCPTIEIGFVDGEEQPQIFVQDMPNVGSMFSADKLTYKIRHPYGGVNLDHRGVDYSVVVG